NVGAYQFVPHCNGTHTECISHLVDDAPPLPEHLRPGLLAATLATVAPRHGVIDAAVMKMALQHHPLREFHQALILRTLPNGKDKLTRQYQAGALPPYLDVEAVALTVEAGVEHLLVDLPSLDPMHDEGRMAAHRLFWQLPPTSRRYQDAKRPHGTITEMIYAPDHATDGYYLLDLQIPAFMADAAPCRPVIYPLEGK
ncbi:MAG TPA: cyclase family protein, partial [Gammaproteobacteria bacterium]|nr:cyclase family protein [Gammaproteobacteria bacterium]